MMFLCILRPETKVRSMWFIWGTHLLVSQSHINDQVDLEPRPHNDLETRITPYIFDKK